MAGVARPVEPLHAVLGSRDTVSGLTVMAAGGQAEFCEWKPMGQARAEVAAVHPLPTWFDDFRPRLAARVGAIRNS